MFRIVGPNAKDLCDAHLRPSRRDVLRVGGAGVLGLSLGSLLKLQAVQAAGTASPLYCVSPGNTLLVTLGPTDAPATQETGDCNLSYRAPVSRNLFRQLTFNVSIGQAF